MGTKQHTHKKNRHKSHARDPFESFVEKELEKTLIELVNTKSWARSYLALGRLRSITRFIDEASRLSNKKMVKTISVTFRRVR